MTENERTLYRYIEAGSARMLDVFKAATREHETAFAAAREEGRREGFEKAREMAASVVRDMLEWQGPTPVGDRIRAMRDGAGEACTCGAPDPSRPSTLQAAHYADCPARTP